MAVSLAKTSTTLCDLSIASHRCRSSEVLPECQHLARRDVRGEFYGPASVMSPNVGHESLDVITYCMHIYCRRVAPPGGEVVVGHREGRSIPRDVGLPNDGSFLVQGEPEVGAARTRVGLR